MGFSVSVGLAASSPCLQVPLPLTKSPLTECKTSVVHRKGRSHGQSHEKLRFIHKKGGFCGQDGGLSAGRDQSSGDYI